MVTRVQALDRFLNSVHFLAVRGPGASISPASDLLFVDVQEFELLAEPGTERLSGATWEMAAEGFSSLIEPARSGLPPRLPAGCSATPRVRSWDRA